MQTTQWSLTQGAVPGAGTRVWTAEMENKKWFPGMWKWEILPLTKGEAGGGRMTPGSWLSWEDRDTVH